MVPAVLLLSGLDPSGGAGLAADLAVLTSLGVHGLPVATCLTVQSRRGYRSTHPVAPELLAAMVEAALEQTEPRAAKVGLLAGPEQATALSGLLPAGVPWVLDPVLRPTLATGDGTGEELAAAIRRELLPRGPVLTPNLPEALALAGLADRGDPREAAAAMFAAGAAALVLKGGHGGGQGPIVNRLWLADGAYREYTVERCGQGEVHGTGCAFASALAGCLALGVDLPAAVERAGLVVGELVRRSWSAGPGPSVLGFGG